jgi:L-ascorbate metabolism protein UlaG (beta-lactamase superfamily)
MIETVTSSHNHTHHLDAEKLLAFLAANPALKIVVPAANRSFAAERLSLDEQRLTPIDVVRPLVCGEFRLHAVPAAHESLERDELGRYRYLGYVIEFGPWKLYHSGDTLRYAGQAELLQQFQIDVALLPINGRSPERRVEGNLWGHEAAELAHDADIQLVIPCHYDMFEFNTSTPESFLAHCAKLSQSCHVLRNGQRWSSENMSPRPASLARLK